jgi:hypothetical protein
MPETIEEAKKRLGAIYLGKGGIYGLGISRAAQAIQVYVTPNTDAQTTGLLEQLRQAAMPFPVNIIREESPEIL